MFFFHHGELTSTEKGFFFQWILCYLLRGRQWTLLDYNWIFYHGGRKIGELDLVMQRPQKNFHGPWDLQNNILSFSWMEKKDAQEKVFSFCPRFDVMKPNNIHPHRENLKKTTHNMEKFFREKKQCFSLMEGDLVFIEIKYRKKLFLKETISYDFPFQGHQKKALEKTIYGFLEEKKIPPHHPFSVDFFLITQRNIYHYPSLFF